MNKIINEVEDWLSNYDETDKKSYLEDLQQHGCVSGMVGNLIYYHDTCKFYNKHRQEIFALVEDYCANTGYSLKEFLQGANHFPLDKEELEALLAKRKLEARESRLQRFRKTGRALPVGDVPSISDAEKAALVGETSGDQQERGSRIAQIFRSVF